MSNITSYLASARNIIANAGSRLGTFQTGEGFQGGSSEVSDLLARRERLQQALNNSLPSYVRETIEADLAEVNAELRTAVEAEYQTYWEGLSTAEKQEVLRDVYSDVAAELGIDPTSLVFIPFGEGNAIDSGLIGLRSSDGNIYIDSNDINGVEFSRLMNIVAHETYHQYQDALIAMLDDSNATLPAGIDEATVERWEENQANYITYSSNPEGYRTQPVESSAYDYGADYRERFYEDLVENYPVATDSNSVSDAPAAE